MKLNKGNGSPWADALAFVAIVVLIIVIVNVGLPMFFDALASALK